MKVKRNRALWAMLAISALLLATGCATRNKGTEPSPIQLDTAQMVETAAAETPMQSGDSLRERLDAPETCQYHEQNGIVTLSIDASVLVPEALTVPVVRTNGADFSQEQVDKVLSLLWGDETMWDNNPPMTRAQIEEEIASIERNLETLPDYQDERDYFETIRLPELHERLKTAPETVSPVQSDGKLTQEEILDASTDKVAARVMRLSIYSESGQYLSVSNNEDNTAVVEHTRNGRLIVSKWAHLRYQREQARGSYLPQMILTNAFAVSPKDTAIPATLNTTVRQSPAEAAEIVRCFFAALGEDVSIRDEFLFDDAGQGLYLFRCVRNVQGIPAILTAGESTALYWNSEDEEKPDAVWGNETITLVVDSNSILQFDWDSPHAIGETMVADCTLLLFSEILDVGVKMLPLIFNEQWGHVEDMTSATIQINRIEFGMMRVIKNQSIDEGLLVPVWAFYGSRPFESASMGSKNQPKSQPMRLLVINAIDGTVIDPTD